MATPAHGQIEAEYKLILPQTAVHDHVSTTGGAALTASLTGWTILLGLGLSVGLIFV